MGVSTFVLLTAICPVAVSHSEAWIDATSVIQCDVVVIGGSVAGLSAAVTAAKEGADVCLLEPTDMLGGQMTANGVPALDFSPEDCKPGTPFNTRYRTFTTACTTIGGPTKGLQRLPHCNILTSCDWMQ